MQPRIVGSLVRVWVVLYGPGGSYPLLAAIDTGASYMVIPRRIAGRLGYDLNRAARHVPVSTASGTTHAPLIVLDAISLAGCRVPATEALCLDLPARLGVRCLVGLSALRHFDVDLHFRSGKFELRGP